MNLAEKYSHFYAPAFTIELEGQDLVAQGIAVTGVTVDQITDGAAKFSFTVAGLVKAYGSMEPEKLFSFGQKVEIYLGYGSLKRLVIQGLITSVSYSFSTESPVEVRVEGYDLLFPMMRLRQVARKKKKQIWTQAKDSQVAEEIAREYFKKSEIADTKVIHQRITQKDEENDYQFLKRLAERNGFEIFARVEQEDKTSIFRFAPPLLETGNQHHPEPDLTLTFGQELFSFHPSLKMNQVVSQVIVRGWDPKTKKEIEAKAPRRRPPKRSEKITGPEAALKALKEPVTLEVRLPVFSREEAQARAEALLLRASQGLVEGEGECIGLPELIPGKVVAIEGLSERFAGPYYVYQVTHTIGANGYRTTFKVKEASLYVP